LPIADWRQFIADCQLPIGLIDRLLDLQSSFLLWAVQQIGNRQLAIGNLH
jgi:hypothetical protein